MIGFATINAEGFNTTTGGNGGKSTHVSSLEEIHEFVEKNSGQNKKILVLTKSIESPESIQFKFKNGANLTIRGENGVKIKNFGFFFDNYHNVIIENLIMHEVFYPNDPITINNSHHFYIHRNELYSVHNDDVYKDTYDGLIDIKRGSRYITIDSNYLHDHNKCMLIGHTDDISQREQDSQISVTLCNNHFKNIRTRCPSIRFGTLHVFNNKYEDIPDDYAIAARQGARVLIENNHFLNVKHVVTTKFIGELPKIKLSSDNIYEDNDNYNIERFDYQQIEFNDSGFMPPYKYNLIKIKQ